VLPPTALSQGIPKNNCAHPFRMRTKGLSVESTHRGPRAVVGAAGAGAADGMLVGRELTEPPPRFPGFPNEGLYDCRGEGEGAGA
jgi:hypothetical protein